MVILCEEVEILPRPAADTVQVTECYRLCRVPSRVEPSLVHMRSVVYSAKGNHIDILEDQDLDPDPNVFLDPAGLLGWLEKCV